MWDWSNSKSRGPGRARPARRRVPERTSEDSAYDQPHEQRQPYYPPENRQPSGFSNPQRGGPQGKQPPPQRSPQSPPPARRPVPPVSPPPPSYGGAPAPYYPDAQGQQYTGGVEAGYVEDTYSGVDTRHYPDGFSSIGRGGGYEEPVPQEFGAWQPPMLSNDGAMWESQFERMNFQGMTLKECQFIFLDPDSRNELRSAFKRARRDFLKFVGYHHSDELRAAGVSQEGLKIIRRGRSPENYNVHMKVPVDYSGSNDFSNLVIIQTHPYHDEIHKFLDMQIAQHPVSSRIKRLYIPIPQGKVFVPGGGVISSGGKDMEDKSIHAGFLEKHFAQLTIRKKMAFGGD